MRHRFRLSCIAITCMALVALNSQCSGVPQSGTPTGSWRNSSVVMGAAAALQVKFAGKMMCVAFLPDGNAVAAGRGILSRSSWKIEAGQICGPDEPGPRSCIQIEKIGENHYRSSDGITWCVAVRGF
jgi:hypothetical protein